MIHNILAQIKLHWLQDAIDLYFALNVIAVGCRVMGWSRLADELSKIEKAIQAMVDAILNRGKSIPIIILCLGLSFAMGCASTLYKGGCGTLTSSKNTVPYTLGTAGGSATGCYMACIGNCKVEDFSPIETVLSDYIKNTPKDNTIKTVDGGTITYIPLSK